MTYNIHGGHAKHGNRFSGAVGFCYESYEDRLIKDSVIKFLRQAGATAYDCTIDSGTSASNIIAKIKAKVNEHRADVNLSIHLNAIQKVNADGKTKGVECLVYSQTEPQLSIAKRICSNIAALGFTNRGVKTRTDLGVLKGTTNGGVNILVECFFCDDEDDFNQYKKVGVDAFGKAIAEGLLGKKIADNAEPSKTDKFTEFVCTINTDRLNVRKGPGTEYPIFMVVLRGYKYTIVDRIGDWGKLKSGAGWINLKYTK